MKKTLFLSSLFLLLSSFSTTYASVPSTCTSKRFTVTAYYSPLPNQAFYNMNSYQEEKVMNGNGTHGASWKAVFNGMVAAPKSYTFGTQIYFPGWWITEIADRGGRIVNAWERGQTNDRIDFWVWKWDEWLRRALSFGVQTLDGYVCPPWTYSKSSLWLDYDVFPYYKDFFDRMIRIISMRPGRDDIMVKSLQYFLANLWYMSPSDTTGFYGPRTKAAICAFQQKALSLPKSHDACWTYGPQTRAALSSVIRRSWLTLASIRKQLQWSHQTVIEKTHWERWIGWWIKKQLPEKRLLPLDGLFGLWWEFASYRFDRPLITNETSREVRVLQRKLQWLWYYDPEKEISGLYDRETIQALYALQLEYWVLDGSEDPSLRGYFGPGTREVVNSL